MIFEADFFCITIHLANTAAFLCSRPYTRQSGESMAVGDPQEKHHLERKQAKIQARRRQQR